MNVRRKRSARGSGEDLRVEILAAARALLLETGHVDAVSIRAIGDAVGVSAPSIYRHFADKDVLIEAVCEEVFQDLESALMAAVVDDESPLERLVSYGKAYVRFACEHPEHYRIGMMKISDEATALDHTLTNGAVVRLLVHINDCIAAGYFPPSDPLPLALEAWALAHGLASLQISKPYLPWGDRDALVDRALRASLAGYCVLGAPPGHPIPPDVVAWNQAFR